MQSFDITGGTNLQNWLDELEATSEDEEESSQFQVNVNDTSLDVEGQYLSV